MAKTPVIAIIGCGAIAKTFHLPALARHDLVLQRAVLVDTEMARAKSLATEYGIHDIADDYETVLPNVDAAIVTTPHHLHYSITDACIRNGVHVLCEKPFVVSPAEAHVLVSRAEDANVALLVNNTRRLFPGSQKVKELLRTGTIGDLRRIQFYEGEKADWPSASGFYFGKMGSGKGVLLDRGAHVLDLICWWLGGKPQLLSYQDDSLGGSEAVASIVFEYENCRGEVHLSWLSRYKNTFRIEGELGSIEAGIYDSHSLTLAQTSRKESKLRLTSRAKVYNDFATTLIDNLIAIVAGTERPLIAGSDVIESLELIEECYAKRLRFPMPWHDAFRSIVHG